MPGQAEITHTYSKRGNRSQTPQAGYINRGYTYMNVKKTKKVKRYKPNSGNTGVREATKANNKITQYFFQEKTTDDKGIREGNLKGKAGERVKGINLTHKLKQRDDNYDDQPGLGGQDEQQTS